jgi:hypothetical protein
MSENERLANIAIKLVEDYQKGLLSAQELVRQLLDIHKW